MTTPPDASVEHYSRRMAAVISVLSSLFVCAGSIILLLIFTAFSTLTVAPGLDERLHSKAQVHAMLFAGGAIQFTLVVFFTLVACTSFVSVVVNSVAAVTRTPSIRATVRICAIGGAVLTGMVLLIAMTWALVP